MATRDKPYATELSAFMGDFQQKHGRPPGATEVYAWWSTVRNTAGPTAKGTRPTKLPIGEKRPVATTKPSSPTALVRSTKGQIRKLPRMAKGGIIRAKTAPRGRAAPRGRGNKR